MRNLKLPALYRCDPFFTFDEDFDEAREIRRASGRIISATSAIEQSISEIIANSIFGEVKEQRELVLGSVLNSDWCSMAAKRKLLNIAIEEFDLLSGTQKNSLEANLKKVTGYRNAFAHGTLVHNGEQQELHYFEGTQKKCTLDDAYFEKLESIFLSTWNELLQIIEKLKNKFIPTA